MVQVHWLWSRFIFFSLYNSKEPLSPREEYKPGEKAVSYDNQAMQLAAYAATYWGEENIDRVLAANVFISTTEPGRMDVVKHPTIARDWQAFKLVAALWRYVKGYDPRTAGQG